MIPVTLGSMDWMILAWHNCYFSCMSDVLDGSEWKYSWPILVCVSEFVWGCEENVNGNDVIVRAKIRTRDFRSQSSLNHRIVTFGTVIYIVINKKSCNRVVRLCSCTVATNPVLLHSRFCTLTVTALRTFPKVRTNIEVLWSCTSLCNYFFAVVMSLSYTDCA